MNNVHVVLVRPTHPGNVGAVARVMANFGFARLRLVNPACSVDDEDCRNRAKHAQRILDHAKKMRFSSLKKYDLVIATTAKLGNQYNIKRLALTPRKLKERLPKKGSVALVFGAEGDGLTNEEIEACDYVVHIPVSSDYPTLNLAQSAGIILYELHDAMPRHEIVDKAQKDIINKLISTSLPRIGFTDARKMRTQQKTWNQVLSKASMTKREAFVIIGFLKKVLRRR